MTLPASSPSPGRVPTWKQLYTPKLVTVLREGYSLTRFQSDFFAGLTVAIVALPLSLALAIASGATPDKGLITVVVAGLLISLLGGSRVQIGGPTGAFVVVVFNVIARHGYDGLILATLMAGAILVFAGLVRLGTWIKYMPQPVVTGFTSGIAVIIFSSQIPDIFGLKIDKVPGDFFAKWGAFWQARDTFTPASLIVSVASLLVIVLLRRLAPKLPGLLIAVAGASVAVWALHLNIPTIGSQFGGIPRSLPAPHFPAVTLAKIHQLLPSALTIAFLAGVESLLSAVVADGMIGRRHRSNCELVAQGIANIGSALFGGLPATGAIARTAANIRSGGTSPVSGILHAVFVFLFMLLFAPLAAYIPLASLAAVLAVVAWNMSELDRFRSLLRAPVGDVVILLATFFLTVVVDLTVAIETGVVLAALFFMHRMSEAFRLETNAPLLDEDAADQDQPGATAQEMLPPGIESFYLRGPFFFGVVSKLLDILDHLRNPPKAFILRMEEVPVVDSSGAAALSEFIRRCRKNGTAVILSSLHEKPRLILQKMHILKENDGILIAPDFAAARALAEKIVS